MFRATGWPVAASLIFVVTMAGQLMPLSENKVTPPPNPDPLLEKVMTDLPGYGENATPAPTPESNLDAEVTTPTVHFAPFVVVGPKTIPLREAELFTKKAFAREIFKRYDRSAFSSFQHREEARLEDMAALKTYADNLVLIGDPEEGRAIRKESSRLFVRPRDPESEYVVSIFNPRIR